MLSDHFIGNFNWPIADTRSLPLQQFHHHHRFGTACAAKPRWANSGTSWPPGLPLDFSAAAKGETGEQLSRRAHEAGAFIGIAHPAWSQLTIEDGRAIDCAHAVEIYNHGCAIENDRGDGWYLLDQLLTEGKRLTAFATDDAHFKSPDYFGGWVHVKAESLGPEVLLEALKKGHYYSSQGPQIHDISVSGNEISIACSPVDTITVLCGNSRTLVRNGKVHHRSELRLEEAGIRLAAHQAEPVVPRGVH